MITDAEKEAAIKKMGQMLLQGYAMLDLVCPDCGVPCMRDKQKNEICPHCGEKYKQGGETEDLVDDQAEYDKMAKEYEEYMQARGLEGVEVIRVGATTNT